MKQPNEIETIGLAFFGRISASISHEIKNSLAIVNENAGLLEDLTLLAQKGMPLSFERLQRLSQTIKKQVDRADTIVKKMNRFSHSTDRVSQSVDVYETALFVTHLCERLIRLCNFTVTVIPPAAPVIVSSRLFQLEQLLWTCIEFMMHAAGKGNITLTMEKQTDGARITLHGSGFSPTMTPDGFPSHEGKALQAALDAAIHVDAAKEELRLELPSEIR